MALTFSTYHYNDVNKEQLYALLSLRSEVFVVEQRCHYQDIDFYDQTSHHIFAHEGDVLVGCARIVAPGTKDKYPAIGRYALKESARGDGQGRALFAYAIAEVERLYPGQAIYIQGQHYLERLYQSMGFETVSDIYLDAGIDHVDMLRPAS